MRVMLAEDSALLREGLVRLLKEEGHGVLAAVGDADALLEAVDGVSPDAVVIDVRMPPTHTDEGLRAALEIRLRRPEVKVLVLSQHVEKKYATELMSGSIDGVGYLLKDRVAQVGDLLDALERVGEGGTAFDPEVVQPAARAHQPCRPAGPAHRPRAPGARTHGPGPDQRLDRPVDARVAERGGKARQRPVRQARAVAHDRLQPPGRRPSCAASAPEASSNRP